jgi:ParB-like chromosome segregation protein Spo0J
MSTAIHIGTPPEFDHVSIRQRYLYELQPSPENDQLYRPASPDDPEIQALAASIKEHGVKEPLVITLDDYILSGHRRYTAAILAERVTVPCRVEKVRRGDPDYLLLLREYNRQRVKRLDEVVREELVSVDPEEAHRLLVEHREQKAALHVKTVEIEGHKHRAKITAAKGPFLDAILAILNRNRKFWPLTDRHIHYQLLNDPPLKHASKPDSRYANDLASYKATCELVTRARLTGDISWDAIHDPTRPVTIWDLHESVGPFVREQLDDFLKGYYRDYQQSQPNHIEIIGEKNTVEGIIRPVAMRFGIPYTIGRGYCSLQPRHEMAERYFRSGKVSLVLLVLSDFDPEGEDIAHSFARSMRDDFGIDDIVPVKVALTAKQVNMLDLPPAMQAKKKSSRYSGFAAKHGDDVHELEAVPPEQLQAMLTEAIDSVLDVDAFNAEVEAEKHEAAYLETFRRNLIDQVGDLCDFPSEFDE